MADWTGVFGVSLQTNGAGLEGSRRGDVDGGCTRQDVYKGLAERRSMQRAIGPINIFSHYIASQPHLLLAKPQSSIPVNVV